MKTLEDYNRAIKKFCEDNAKSTVYMAGEISHPGISDLDFLIVDDEPVVDELVKPFLMGGNIIVVPDFAMKNLQILENFNVKHLQGKKYNFEKNKVQNTEEKIIAILEWLPERILKCKSIDPDRASKNDVLLLHKSINRSIKAVSTIVGKKYNVITTDTARSDASIENKQLLDTSITFGVKAWSDFASFLIEKNLITGEASGVVEICEHYQFRNTFDHLILYFHYMSNIDCSLSKRLSNRLNVSVKNIDIDSDLFSIMEARWKILSRTYDWFLEKNLKAGMIKYGWLLK